MKRALKAVFKGNYQQVFFVFLAFLAMVLVSYYYVSDIVSDQTRIIGEETMLRTETAVEAMLSQSQLSFYNISQTVGSMLENNKTNEEILGFLKLMNDYFSDNSSPVKSFMKVYAFLRGEFLDGSGWVPPGDYVPQSRPWYIGADGGSQAFFSQPYTDADTGGICISFSRAVFTPDGVQQGIVAIDLDLSQVIAYTDALSLGGSGYGVLLSDNMVIVGHKNADLIEKNLAGLGHDYTRLAQVLEAEDYVSAMRMTDYDGTDSMAFFNPVLGRWYIGVITPRADYYRQVYYLGVVLGALGFLLMLALSYILVKTRYEKNQSDEESRSKSDFLSRMSHEMRTPMNAIIGMTEAARKSDDRQRINYCLDKVHDASTHLLGVINDILDMSKIEAGKLEMLMETVEVQEIADRACNLVGFKIAEKNQEFECTVAPDVPKTIVTDRLRLTQALANLLSNAGKFTPEGGKISLSISNAASAAYSGSAGAETISRAGGKNGRHVLLFQIIDTGIGISPQQQDKLFRSFGQADAEISHKYGGTGLGLAITKRIIEILGGSVAIDSRLGQGSNFYFTLPVEEGAPLQEQEEAAPAAQEDLDLAGKRLLVAEDVAINREVLLAQLDGLGLDIDFAENGKEACAKFAAANGRYDLVFMDLQMPEMDGLEATRCIRAMQVPGAGTVPIVAMTANVFRQDVEQCLAAGMNGHLGKPLDMDAVMEVLRRVLN